MTHSVPRLCGIYGKVDDHVLMTLLQYIELVDRKLSKCHSSVRYANWVRSSMICKIEFYLKKLDCPLKDSRKKLLWARRF